jgi:hypothetical protein
VKLAVKGGLLFEPRVTGKRVFGHVERELIVAGGTRQLRESVGVGETSGDKARAVRHGRWVDNCRGARGAERRRQSLRGESSEGRSQERLRHETRPRNFGLLGNR